MAPVIDYFFSFRSPYSYLSVPRVLALPVDFDVQVRLRVVLPIAVRTPEFFDRINPLWPPYLVNDCIRLAEFHGMGFHWPRPDPVVQDFATRTIPAQQPHIHRLTRLGVLAQERGRGLEFVREISQIIWNGEVEGWNEGDHMTAASRRAELDLSELDPLALSDGDRLDLVVRENQDALQTAGHWGVPTLVLEGEPFFGQDRIELLRWRLDRRGLRRR